MSQNQVWTLAVSGTRNGVELAIYANVEDAEDIKFANKFQAFVVNRDKQNNIVFPSGKDLHTKFWQCYTIKYAELKLKEYADNIGSLKNASADRALSC